MHAAFMEKKENITYKYIKFYIEYIYTTVNQKQLKPIFERSLKYELQYEIREYV